VPDFWSAGGCAQRLVVAGGIEQLRTGMLG
jgi:hypothetical protein